MLVQFTVILLILCTTNLTFLSLRLAPKHCLFGPQVGPYVHSTRSAPYDEQVYRVGNWN